MTPPPSPALRLERDASSIVKLLGQATNECAPPFPQCNCALPQDRRKLLQFVIIYAISPETFPYVVLYAPSLLPSTYEKPHTVRSNYNR